MKNELENYLTFVIKIIIEEALLAKQSSQEKQNVASEFYYGKRLAYYEVLTTLKNQAMIMDIPLESIGLQNIDPDKDIA